MRLVLHKLNASPPARAVMVTAQLLGLDIETRDINILAKDNWKPDFLEKNPLHTIPVLEDGNLALADSHAIMTYLVTKYGAGKSASAELYPIDARERVIVDQRLYLDASILFPRLKTIVFDIVFGTATAVDEKKAADVEEAYGFLEKYLGRTPFVAGGHITLADISCVTTVSSLNVAVPISDKYPRLLAWLDTLSKLDWYQKKNQPGLEEFTAIFNGSLKRNAQ